MNEVEEERIFNIIIRPYHKNSKVTKMRVRDTIKETSKQIFDDIEKCIHTDEFGRQTCEYDSKKYEKLKKKWLK